MNATNIVCDANVVLKWFHTEGEERVAEARALVAAHKARTAILMVLDLTAYEVGNALLRGPAKASARQVEAVLGALSEICPAIRPDLPTLRLAAQLAARHRLTLYDAIYGAAAQSRGATLATHDSKLLEAGLGTRPSEIIQSLGGE